MPEIALLAYPGCMGTELFGLSDFLLVAHHTAVALAPGQHEPLHARVVGARSGPVRLAGGAMLQVPALRGRPDLLVVPGLEVGRFGVWDEQLAPLGAELALIRRRHRKGLALASVCIGSFLLAQAGVLAGRQAATAWVFEREFAQRYPSVHLLPNAVLCSDGPVTTAGAVSSVFDLGLHLITRHYGSHIARAASRLALVGGVRPSQQPYVDASLMPRERGLAFAEKVHTWLHSRLTTRYDLAALAAALHTSTRTVLRRYRKETGQTPLAWLQEARVRQAQRLLEDSRKSVSQIVAEVGYEDVATFSRMFKRHVGESPAGYRRRTGSRAAARNST